ncbi:6507_t:CDS:10, partial [Entrophospora sp. SA101]
EFTQLLKGLQGERLRQEFKYYDKEGIGYIKPGEFKKMILSISKHKLSDYVLEHLPTLCNVSTTKKISYAAVVAFHNVLRQMDMVERIVMKAISESKDGRITKNDFLNTAAKETRFSLFTPLETDIIFHFASLGNPSGRLGKKDFVQLLDQQWQKPPVIKPLIEIDSEKLKKVTGERTGFIWNVLHQVYSFAMGSIAGAVGATVVYPIDLVKTRMQNQRSKVVAPEKAIKLTVNDLVRSLLTDKETGKIPTRYEILAGGTAGGCQVIFTNPLEIVKIRLQVQGELSRNLVTKVPPKSAIWIVRSLGIVGLYKGVNACLLRDIPFSAIYFPSYAHIKKDLFNDGVNGKRCSIFELLLSGALAGMPAAYLTTPADVIKTRLQVEARTGQTQYNGIIDATKKILKEEGFGAFFKGGPARVFRSSPQFGTTLMVYELLQRWFPWNVKAYTTTTAAKTDNIGGDSSRDLDYLKSRNALKILLDLDYKFGVSPNNIDKPIIPNYQEEQNQEIEVLKSIYPDELEEINEKEFRIIIEPEDQDRDLNLHIRIALHIKYTPKYPEETPIISIDTLEGELSEEEHDKLYSEISIVADDSLGMAMVFTLSTLLKDLLTTMENARFKGTKVTYEAFLEWKKLFDKKMEDIEKSKKDPILLKKEESRKNKLTGRQLFEQDKSLAKSDSTFIEDDDVTVDVSLFEKESIAEGEDEDEDEISVIELVKNIND